MDLSINKTDLNRILQITQNIVARKTPMPILCNVLLTATDQSLKISSSDLEVTAVITSKANVRSAGSTTVNAKVFSDIVRELQDGEISLKLKEGERLEICTKGSIFKIVGVSAEEYPALPGVNIEPKGKINAAEFVEMISKTIYAVSHEETRFVLNGVCFESMVSGEGKNAKDQIRLVAVDGHRLAMITKLTSTLKFQGRIVVPKKGLSEISRIVSKEVENEEEIGIDVTEGFLIIQTSNAKVSMRLIDGEFPDYNQVIPKTTSASCVTTINAKKLEDALRRVVLMVTDKAKCVRLDFSNGKLKVSSSSPELGEANEEMEVTYGAKPISVGFNAQYLLDVVASHSNSAQSNAAHNINIELNGELGPTRIWGENDDSYIAVIMPMRLS